MYAVIVTHSEVAGSTTTVFGPFSMKHGGKPNPYDFVLDAKRRGYEAEMVLLCSHKMLDSFADAVRPQMAVEDAAA